jgi:hypothetical protein
MEYLFNDTKKEEKKIKPSTAGLYHTSLKRKIETEKKRK